jgi:hypothetical protein
MDHVFGAISRGNALATVERRAGTYLLACVHGDLATIAIESVKSSFARLTKNGDAAARELAGAAPPMIAPSAAVALIDGDRAYIASAGGGVAYRQRGGASEVVLGEVQLLPGDDLIVVGGPLTITAPMFEAPANRSGAQFANDTLDGELAAGVERLAPAGALAIAAVRAC